MPAKKSRKPKKKPSDGDTERALVVQKDSLQEIKAPDFPMVCVDSLEEAEVEQPAEKENSPSEEPEPVNQVSDETQKPSVLDGTEPLEPTEDLGQAAAGLADPEPSEVESKDLPEPEQDSPQEEKAESHQVSDLPEKDPNMGMAGETVTSPRGEEVTLTPGGNAQVTNFMENVETEVVDKYVTKQVIKDKVVYVPGPVIYEDIYVHESLADQGIIIDRNLPAMAYEDYLKLQGVGTATGRPQSTASVTRPPTQYTPSSSPSMPQPSTTHSSPVYSSSTASRGPVYSSVNSTGTSRAHAPMSTAPPIHSGYASRTQPSPYRPQGTPSVSSYSTPQYGAQRRPSVSSFSTPQYGAQRGPSANLYSTSRVATPGVFANPPISSSSQYPSGMGSSNPYGRPTPGPYSSPSGTRYAR